MRCVRRWVAAVCAGLLLGGVMTAAFGDISLRVYDNGSTSDDDIARVRVDGQDLGTITAFPGGTNQKTFYLPYVTAGTHALVIEHTADVDASDLCDEHVGTYGIEFGGGGLSAGDDSASATRGTSTEVDVLANDVYVSAAATATDSIPCPSETPAPTTGCSCDDPRTTFTTTFDVSDGAGQISIDRIVLQPSKGDVEIVSGGTRIRYTPHSDGCGVDTFSYQADGPSGSTDTATVTISIQSSPPVAVNDSSQVEESQTVLINALANDSNPGGGALALQSVGAPAHGTAGIIGNLVRYTPSPRFEGHDRFSYTARNVCGATTTGWIDVVVLHTNHPPEASAGAFYQGIVNEPLVLDASFSHDPDIEDTLQYRWDLDGDSRPDTTWLSDPRYTVSYATPYVGPIGVEVRDLYRGTPSGSVSTATALVRIASIQSIQVFVFEDVNANGVMDAGEPGLPGIELTVGGFTQVTEADGGFGIELTPGTWTVALSALSVSRLESRGFAVPETQSSVTLAVSAIETVSFGVAKTSAHLKGFVFVDLDGDGIFTEENDQLLQGLRVILDDERETMTDDSGRFFFLAVPFGAHTLWVGENVEGTSAVVEEDIPSLLVPMEWGRESPPEMGIQWPWMPTGPGQGFLQIEVQKSDEN